VSSCGPRLETSQRAEESGPGEKLEANGPGQQNWITKDLAHTCNKHFVTTRNSARRRRAQLD